MSYLVNATKPQSVGWSINRASLNLNNNRQIVVSPPEHKILIKLKINIKELHIIRDIINVKIQRMKSGAIQPIR